jgi:hypothetical protein
MNEMEYELKVQIPELGVHRVLAATTDTRDAVMLQIIGYSTWSLAFSRNDLLDQNLLDIFGRNT